MRGAMELFGRRRLAQVVSCCVCDKHGNIPYLFDFWADPFLLKSSMEQCNKKCLRVYCEPQSDHTVQRGGDQYLLTFLTCSLARASTSFIMTSISASNRRPQTEGGGGRGPFYLKQRERERERQFFPWFNVAIGKVRYWKSIFAQNEWVSWYRIRPLWLPTYLTIEIVVCT